MHRMYIMYIYIYHIIYIYIIYDMMYISRDVCIHVSALVYMKVRACGCVCVKRTAISKALPALESWCFAEHWFWCIPMSRHKLEGMVDFRK